MKFSSQPPAEIRIDMINMIDCMIMLLMYFMLAATFEKNPSAIHYDLPSAESGGSMTAPEPWEFIVDKEGRIFYGNTALDDDALERRVQELGALPEAPGKTVVIRADTEARHGRVIHLMDLLRRNRITRLAVGVKKE